MSRSTIVGAVESVDAAGVNLVFERASVCVACDSGVGCGLGPVLALFTRRRSRRMRLPRTACTHLMAGDRGGPLGDRTKGFASENGVIGAE